MEIRKAIKQIELEKSGVYCIYCKNRKDYIYYGCSKNMKKRAYNHFINLKNAKHYNIFNSLCKQFGIESMMFEPIVFINKNRAKFFENEFIVKDVCSINHISNTNILEIDEYLKIIKRRRDFESKRIQRVKK